LFLLTAGAAFAKPKLGPTIPPNQREPLIREAYAKLAELAQAGGHAISFKLDDVQTIKSADFDKHVWVHVLTPPGGARINVARSAERVNGVLDSVIYRARWQIAPDNLGPKSNRALDGLTVADVIRTVAVEQPAVGTASALSSYEVEVAFDGRSRTYRAAALWLPRLGGRAATVFFLDHVTGGIENAAREQPPSSRVRVQPDQIEKVVNGTCTIRNAVMLSAVASDSSAEGHFYGGDHVSRQQVRFTCSYNGNCSARCTPEWTLEICEDQNWDNTTYYHEIAQDQDVTSGTTNDARGQGPACGAGYGCVMQKCILGFCSLGIAVGFTGPEASFSTSGTVDWNGSHKFRHGCGPAELVPPNIPAPPPHPPVQYRIPADDGGGGGGGGGNIEAALISRTETAGGYICEFRFTYTDPETGQTVSWIQRGPC
jgi:hypothetical protein